MKEKLPVKAERLRNREDTMPNESGIYFWLCDKDKLKEIIGIIYDAEGCTNKTEKILESSERMLINEKEYYCIYVGKAKSLRRRIIRNHICGKTRSSTLRRTIRALYCNRKDERIASMNDFKIIVDNQIDNYLISYEEFAERELEKEEKEQIEKYQPIFNLKDCGDRSALRDEIISLIKQKRQKFKQDN